MNKLLIATSLFLILCAFKADTVYNPSHDGHYSFVNKETKKQYGWDVKANPKHEDKVDFFHTHKTEASFTVTMIDDSHFKTKGLLGHTETDGAFTRDYDVYGEFIDSTAVFVHFQIHRTRQVGNTTLVKDTSYQCKYFKHKSKSEVSE